MLIKPEQLSEQLNRQLSPVVWISGDEPLLVQECCDQVRQFARQAGFSDREVFNAGPGFNWHSLLESGNTLSLFADRKILDLRLPSSKLDKEGKDSLQTFIDSSAEDSLLLISSPRVEKAAMQAKWFRQLDPALILVQVWPVNVQQLPAWIEKRMQQHNITADREAIQLLVQRVEGNLLAAAQEIEKLALISDGRVDAEIVAKSVADSARFNVFSLVDASLSGDTARALIILHHLKAEGTDSLQILNFLCREIRSLARMRSKIDQGQHVSGVLQSERVWKNRMSIVGHALKQHGLISLQQLIEEARVIDQSVKGLLDHNPWDGLAHMVFRLSRPRTPARA